MRRVILMDEGLDDGATFPQPVEDFDDGFGGFAISLHADLDPSQGGNPRSDAEGVLQPVPEVLAASWDDFFAECLGQRLE